MKSSFFLFVFIFYHFAFAQFKPNSILKTGSFFKLGISQTGVYKIDYDFLKSIGINPETINPNKLKIFGNGYGMLPQANATLRHDDLIENAIKVVDGNDNAFNQGDFLLFYAQGPHSWQYNAANDAFFHTFNLYSDKTFYYLQTDSESNGLRIENQPEELANNAIFVDTYNDKKFIEKDVINLLKSGRLWFGDDFDKILSRTYSFDFAGIEINSNVFIRTYFASISNKPDANPNLAISLNGNLLGTTICLPTQNYTIANGYQINYNINSNSFQNNGTLNLNLTYNKSGDNNAIGYLDYIEVNAKRKLNLINNELIFSSSSSKNNIKSTFSIAAANSNTEVWDISNNTHAKKMNGTLIGNTYQFTTSTLGLIKEFVAINPQAIATRPSFEGKIKNQNIHGSETPKLVIVTHKNFLNEANRLAMFKNKTIFQHWYLM